MFATLGYTPGWANANRGIAYPATDTNDWKNAVRTIVTRYRNDVECWGIWNEPDFSAFWKGTRDEYFTRILRPALRTIREVGTHYGMKIRVCGLDLAYPSNLAAWLDTMVALGMNPQTDLDVITQHAYRKDGTAQQVVQDFLSTVRPTLSARGLRDKPVWLTESGWDRNRRGDTFISDAIRALYGSHEAVCAGTFSTASAWPQWARTYYYHFPYDSTSGWGLLDVNRNPLPQYESLQRWITRHPTTTCRM